MKPKPSKKPRKVTAKPNRKATALEIVEAANTNVIPKWFTPAEVAAVRKVQA
jgi:hypothetical protein